MKYIYKVTIFMVLGLLLVSCSKSNTKAKTNEEIIVRGVLEKGKATDASCTIKTLKGKTYSNSNKITQGGYVASVPAGAFDIQCKINEYIDDKTGKSVTPKTSIDLESISFAKEGKNKTVNVNVLTDLVAKKIDKNKITDETSFNVVRESAIKTALSDIETRLNHNITIGDIDTLHLDNAADNPLTKVSLAIQEQLNKHNPKITTVSGALQAAKSAGSIKTQNASDLSPKAIGKEVDKSVKPPKPIKPSSLDGAMIGGQYIDVSLKEIDITQEVAFSVPARDIGEVVASNSVYITSNKTGETKPIQLKGGKNASYSTRDVKALFKPDGKTTFTICVVPTMKTLDSTANGKCLGAKIKKTFVATAVSSTEIKNPGNAKSENLDAGAGAGIDGAKAPAGGTNTGTGDKDQGADGSVSGSGTEAGAGTPGTGKAGAGTVTTDQGTSAIASLAGATINTLDVNKSPTEIDTTQPVSFSMPASLVSNLGTDESVYIVGESDALVELTSDETAYTSISSISNLFNNGTKTKFTVCIINTSKYNNIHTTMNPDGQENLCLSSLKKQTFTATSKLNLGTIEGTITLNGAKINNTLIPADGTTVTGIDTSKDVPFLIPVNSIQNLGDNNNIYITSNKPNSFLISLTNNQDDKKFYKTELIKSVAGLFNGNAETTFTVCILDNKFKSVEACKVSTAKKTFTATRISIADRILLERAKIEGTIEGEQDVTSSPTIDVSKGEVYFSIPVSSVHLGEHKHLFITSVPMTISYSLTKQGNIYKSDPINYMFLLGGKETEFSVCMLSGFENSRPTCQYSANEKTFKATATHIDDAVSNGIALGQLPSSLKGMTIGGKDVTETPVIVDTSGDAVPNSHQIFGSLPVGINVYLESTKHSDIATLNSLYNGITMSWIHTTKPTTFTICLLPDAMSNSHCSDSPQKATFTVCIKDPASSETSPSCTSSTQP